jgi:hypothetical protein
MTPEDNELIAEYLRSVGELEPGRLRVERARARAKELRGAVTTGPRSMGKFMQAAHPLEHLSTFLQQQAGRRKQEESDAAEDENMAARRKAAQKYYDDVIARQKSAKEPLPVDFGQGPLGTGDLGGMPFPEGLGGAPGQMPMPGQQPFPGLQPAPKIPGMIEDPYGVLGGSF